MKRLHAKITSQCPGFIIGVLMTVMVFGTWIGIHSLIDSNSFHEHCKMLIDAIHAGAMRRIEIPAWIIIIALPLAGVTVAGILQYIVNHILARIGRLLRVRQ
jgi:hypothetical protein